MINKDSTKVIVGKVVSPHGIKGQIRIETDSDNPNRFQINASISIADQAFTVTNSQEISPKYLLLSLEGVTTRQKASELQGSAISVETAAIPKLPIDTYYHYQLIGMNVLDENSVLLGNISEILNTGANDVYVVTDDKNELLIPAVANVILMVDVNTHMMKISLPEGLEWRSNVPKKLKSKKQKQN